MTSWMMQSFRFFNSSRADQSKELWRSDKQDNRLTVFDSSGVAVQDCIIASMVYHLEGDANINCTKEPISETEVEACVEFAQTKGILTGFE